ncbi:Hypothetical protein FKW44_014959, partial [Caligus rogercresseyi]
GTTHNCQNDRILARKKEAVELKTAFRRQEPPSLMIGISVPTDMKKAPMIFIEEGVKVDLAM